MKIYVGHSRDFDYINELYKPLRQSELNVVAELILPHENNQKTYNSKETLKEVDYFIAEVSQPSTGLGIELGWANIYGVPIIAAYRKGSKISNSVKSLAQYTFEYSNFDELIESLKKVIK